MPQSIKPDGKKIMTYKEGGSEILKDYHRTHLKRLKVKTTKGLHQDS
jgi:hypothetical protein